MVLRADRTDTPRLQARSRCLLGRILLQKARRRGESFDPATAALTRARELGDDRTHACAIDQLGLVAEGRADQMRAALAEARGVAEQHRVAPQIIDDAARELGGGR